MGFLEKWAEEHRAKWLANIRPEIQDRVAKGTPISWEEWQGMRTNSFEQEELIPLLDNDALCSFAEYCLKNCRPRDRRPSIVYDDAVLHVIVPLLLKRLKEK